MADEDNRQPEDLSGQQQPNTAPAEQEPAPEKVGASRPVKAKPVSKTTVLCTSERKPWVNGKPMDFGERYEVSDADATLLIKLGHVRRLEADEV